MTLPVEPRAIFIPFFWGIGNMVLFTPALAAMRRTWPRAQITIHATRPGAAQVVKGGPLADSVEVRPIRPGPAGKLAWIGELLGRFDLVVSPLPLPSRLHAALALATRAPFRIGFEPLPAGGAPSWLDTIACSPSAQFDETRHEVDCYLDLARAAGATPTADRRLHVAVGDADREQASRALAAAGLGGAPIIALHVGAHPDMRQKQWSAERFAALAAAIARRGDAVPVLVGGPDDTDAVAATLDAARRLITSNAGAIARPGADGASKPGSSTGASESHAAPGSQPDAAVGPVAGAWAAAGSSAAPASTALPGTIVSLAGQLSLKATAAVFERCRAVVANDSGPMHLAAAVGAPVLGIFGPTNPWKNAPWTAPGRGAVIRMNIGCSPCYRVGGHILCAPTRCLDALDIPTVLAALERLLAASEQPPSADQPWGPADPTPIGEALQRVGPPTTIAPARTTGGAGASR